MYLRLLVYEQRLVFDACPLTVWGTAPTRRSPSFVPDPDVPYLYTYRFIKSRVECAVHVHVHVRVRVHVQGCACICSSLSTFSCFMRCLVCLRNRRHPAFPGYRSPSFFIDPDVVLHLKISIDP